MIQQYINKTRDDDIKSVVEDTMVLCVFFKESATRRQTQLFNVNNLYLCLIVLIYVCLFYYLVPMCHSTARHEDCNNKPLRKGVFLLSLCKFTYRPQLPYLFDCIVHFSKDTVIYGSKIL